jgi:hypothetical protein
MTSKKRPRDPNQLAKMIVDISTGESQDAASEAKKNPPAKRAGGLAGGKARAKKLTPEQRADIARTAASARWKKSES